MELLLCSKPGSCTWLEKPVWLADLRNQIDLYQLFHLKQSKSQPNLDQYECLHVDHCHGSWQCCQHQTVPDHPLSKVVWMATVPPQSNVAHSTFYTSLLALSDELKSKYHHCFTAVLLILSKCKFLHICCMFPCQGCRPQSPTNHLHYSQ